MGYKRHCCFYLGCALSFSLSNHVLWESQLPCQGAALWRGSCRKEHESPVNSHCKQAWKCALWICRASGSQGGGLDYGCVHMHTHVLSGLSEVSFNFVCKVVFFDQENALCVLCIFKNQNQKNEKTIINFLGAGNCNLGCGHLTSK